MAGVLTQVPSHYTTQFEATWDHLVQQEQSRLSAFVDMTSFDGERKRFNQLDKQEFNLVTGRAQQTVNSDVAMPLRWIYQKAYDLSNLQDEWDEKLLGEVVSPTSALMQSHLMGYRRLVDRTILDALGGNAYTGEDGTTPTALPNSQIVGVQYGTNPAANIGLTLSKLIQARSILAKAEALQDGEEAIFVYRQEQLDDLLRNVDQVSNSRYSDIKALQTGETDYFMGFRFKKTQLVSVDSNDIASCYAYVKRGIKFADNGRKNYMDILPERRHALQIRSTCLVGAVRMQEPMVVQVLCDQSP